MKPLRAPGHSRVRVGLHARGPRRSDTDDGSSQLMSFTSAPAVFPAWLWLRYNVCGNDRGGSDLQTPEVLMFGTKTESKHS